MPPKKPVRKRKLAKPRRRAAVGPPPRPASATLDLQPAGPPALGDIPWAYGESRVTAMARDPHWIYIYWELTDEAIARARAEVNSAVAGVVLRVYDTTFRVFDGTNANSYRDVPVDRAANNHYVCVDRPAATFHVDIGVKSPEGYFAKIARSGAVETPRDSVAPDGPVDWMTVSPDDAPPASYEHRFVPGPESPALPPPEARRILQSLAGEGWTRAEWNETDVIGRTVRWIRWKGAAATIEIEFQGERRVVRTEQGEQVVYGPWRVTIYAFAPDGTRAAIDHWVIHYTSGGDAGSLPIETAAIVQRILQGHRAILVRSGSEVRLMREGGWSSESSGGRP